MSVITEPMTDSVRTSTMPERSGVASCARSAPIRILLLFAAFYVGPLLILVFAAMKSLPEFFADPTGLPESFELANFGDAWELANFPGYLLNSLIYTVVGTTLFVIMSVFVAFPIARGYVKGSGAMLTLYVVALFLPPALIPAVPADPEPRPLQHPTGLHPACS